MSLITALESKSTTEASLRFPIYLDHNATTPCDEAVLQAMLPYFCNDFGNAASMYGLHGWNAHKAVEQAREKIADALGAQPENFIFTSGATESNNLGIRGVFRACNHKGKHIITSSIEHPATLATLRDLEQEGARVSYLEPLPDGSFDIDAMKAAITPETILITVMYANNEIGTINPIDDIAVIAQQHGILFMSDATQALGKVDINLTTCPIDILTCSAHKIYGPKGVGGLYLRHQHGSRVVDIRPQITGGGSEQGLRGGTLNVPGIVGFAKAVELAQRELRNGAIDKVEQLRDKLEDGLLELQQVQVNGISEERLPHVCNVSFHDTDGKKMLSLLKKSISVSTGSACSSSNLSPSHVLTALGLSDELAQATIRFSLGRHTTEAEIDFALNKVREVAALTLLL
ncbi:cysteine desulfurase family protein [Pseudoalteromonas sp. OANN1]|uniref:cysteine desulfurase family protein n=1 Tax=Pseudoalteromonas sp. OANN1 TaxID=2954497 RepID=UPI0020968BC4|nr:cysteine desulfurase family protein [Pseudoalteromonas sp. OANN1]MCO7201176.1 cysteine desulfurase [Pseudoalteromonas sp. OANN1]